MSKVYQITTSNSTLSHAGDATSGIRPWESQQHNISSGATFTIGPAQLYADTSNGSVGVAWGFAQPPTYVTGTSVSHPYLIVYGNDYIDFGSGTPLSMPSGTAYMDHIVQVVVPHSGGWSNVESNILGLMEGVTISVGGAESH